MNNKLELGASDEHPLRVTKRADSLVNRVLELWRLSPLANVSWCAAEQSSLDPNNDEVE